MKIFDGFECLPRFRGAVVTVGSFDGVHTGHLKLLDAVVGKARATGGESVVVTFSPHPREVLGDGVRLLTTLPEKALLMERAGVDNLIVAPFTLEFSRLSADDFARDYLAAKVGASTLVVGYNHRFGHAACPRRADNGKRSAIPDRGKTEQGQSSWNDLGGHGFDVATVERHEAAGGKVSSTVIRSLIAAGRLADAAPYLGYDYFITGRTDGSGVLTPSGTSKLLPPAGEHTVVARSQRGQNEHRELQPSAWGGYGLPDLPCKSESTLIISPDGTLALSPAPTAGEVCVTFNSPATPATHNF